VRVYQFRHIRAGGHCSRGYSAIVIAEGQPAPDFELQSDSGETVRLADLRGKPVVLYFYPKDDTPGCTAQACGIRDAWSDFRKRGAVVFGISPDDERSHTKFKEKYSLPFTLLADPDHRLTEELGFWVQKKFAGKKYMGVERSTVVIDPEGNVAKVFRKVKPADHAAQVLQALG
jgi:peroxiredoxin Q/BCP